MRWETLALALTFLSTGLAGCVKPIDEAIDDCSPCCDEDCGGWGSAYGCDPSTVACCHRPCGIPPVPPTRWDPPVCPAVNRSRYTSFHGEEPAILCAVPMPPLLAPLVPRELDAKCDACASAAVATDGRRAFVATERALLVADAREVKRVEYPARWLERPHLAVGLDERAWIVGIDRAQPLPSIALLAYDGGSSFSELATLDVAGAPVLPLVERAYVSPTAGGAVVVLVAQHAAWSARYSEGLFTPLERLTPIGGDALVGAPTTDMRGSVLVPFAFTPRDALQTVAGALIPATQLTSLYYLSSGSDGAGWTTHGGMGVPQGAATGPSLETTPTGVAAFAWVDASGVLLRLETWDDGMSWGTPTSWSGASSGVVGAPAAARYDQRSTVAWREEGGGLVVARSEGGPAPAAQWRTAAPVARGDASLALLGDGRALVAWVDETGSVWAGIEGGELAPPACGSGAHCSRASYQ